MINISLKENNQQKFTDVINGFLKDCGEADKVKALTDFRKYILNNREECVNRKILDIPGSCTEGLVSLLLSEQLNRNPIAWSMQGPGKIASVRVSKANGNTITAENMKPATESESENTYSEYLDKIMA